ncbi:glycosyl transferases group 1 family protein [Lyngbya aestuarii BL J]|uniref:Glycosyl transferases group 1 family protein n=1 Tax=Lyngbya aestuarii BL J TaxID=1348334 RepID=U7QNF5_9CYAN|nr:glycosyltransferase family 4 protein [Lyngbya aestuarii]ERT08822.1 glycosyl transferases group 1 family protein [Lyngbya aestuarii BL J]
MRILIYSYNYHPEPIGIAPLMTELAEGLVKQGHEVRVVTGMPNYPQRRIYDEYQGKSYLTEERNGVSIQRSYIFVRGPEPGVLDRILLDGSFIFTSLFQAINGWRPDVIFATEPPLLVCVPVALYAWVNRCPFVLNIQDIVSEAAVRVNLLKKGGPLVAIAEMLEKFAYWRADQLSVIATGFIETLEQKGVPSKKISYIPNWVDTDFIRPLPKENNPFRKEHQLEDKFVILYSGNIALTQGLETVIQAAAKLKHIPEIAFVIVGEERALGHLQEYCNTCDATNVCLLPFQPREKLPEMLSAADIGLVIQKSHVTVFNLPSKIPVLLASGCAVVGSVPDTGTAKEAIVKSGAGVVVPPEDAEALANSLLELYHDPERVKRLGERGRKYAEEFFSFEQALKQYETLFSEVVPTEKVSLFKPIIKSNSDIH